MTPHTFWNFSFLRIQYISNLFIFLKLFNFPWFRCSSVGLTNLAQIFAVSQKNIISKQRFVFKCLFLFSETKVRLIQECNQCECHQADVQQKFYNFFRSSPQNSFSMTFLKSDSNIFVRIKWCSILDLTRNNYLLA